MRIKQLDILRTVAVLLVLLSHAPRATDQGLWFETHIIEHFRRFGWIGVDLFFVLSGFLVSGLLFREQQRYGRIDLKRFYIRRGFKIYPVFYVMVLATVALRPATGGQLWPRAVLIESLFLQSYSFGLWGHTWSLGVEEHFYILLPLLLLGLARSSGGSGADPFRRLVSVWVMIALGVLSFRLAGAGAGPFHNRTHIFPTHLRIDSLMFGVLLSYLYHYKSVSLEAFFCRRHRLVALGGFVLILPCVVMKNDTFFVHTLGFTLLYLGMGTLMMCSLYLGGTDYRPLGRIGGMFATVGTYSYSIYLWHIPVFRAWGVYGLEAVLGAALPYWLNFAFYLAGSIVGGIVLAKVIEVPCLALRDRMFPSRTQVFVQTEDTNVSPQAVLAKLRPNPSSAMRAAA